MAYISKKGLRPLVYSILSNNGYITRDMLIKAWCDSIHPKEYVETEGRSALENYIFEVGYTPKFQYFRDVISIVRHELAKKGIALNVTDINVDVRYRAPQGRTPHCYSLPEGVTLPLSTSIIHEKAYLTAA